MKYNIFVKKLLRFLLKPLSFIPAILVMYMIYSFSAQDAVQSSRLSAGFTYKFVQTMDKSLDMRLTKEQTVRIVNKAEHYIRKLAHFTEYFLLAVTFSLPLYVYGLRGPLLVLIAGLFCIGYASFDEFHQLFVSGRSGSYKDVLIDSSGSILGIFFVRILGCFCRNTIFFQLGND